MNKNLKSILITLALISLICIVNTQISLDYCTSYGTSFITYPKYQNLQHDYFQCTGCASDPNRSTTTTNCACNPGYYFNGSECTKHKAGILFEEDFESPTAIADNWLNNESHSDISTIIEFNTQANSNVAKFTRGRGGGDMFTNQFFEGLPFDDKLLIIFDFSIQAGGQFFLGSSRYGPRPSNHEWPLGPLPVTGTAWSHFEFVLNKIDQTIPNCILIEDYNSPENTPVNRVSFDNFIVASTHGPTEINIGAYSNIYPSFMVLSNDYTGFDGSNTLQQFNFDIDNMNTLLGRNDWNTEEFAIYIPETDTVAVVILYDDSGSQFNGATLGRGHGRFKTNASYQDQKYFFPGQYLSFDNKFSRTVVDFERLTGTTQFEGPFKNENQNLAGCFNDCQDFEHFNEALNECMQNTGCDGVKYTHRLWGGSNSQGFNKGYGYQLRSLGVESNTRLFEFSYRKRASFDNSQYHYRAECKKSTLKEMDDFGYSEKSIKILSCFSCDISDINRNNSSPYCLCNDKYYDDGSQCQLRTIGVIQEDNFNTGAITDNWSGNIDDSYTPQAQFISSKFGSEQCITFPSIRTKGDLFFKSMYQTLQHNEEVLIIFDYIDEGNGGLGFGFSNMYPGNYKLLHTTSASEAGTTYLSPQIPKSQTGKWNHFEGTFSAFYQLPFRIMFQEHVSSLGESFLDNYILSTIHEPEIVRNSPYSHLQPILMILGNDFTGFDGTATNQQFSYNLLELETILGRPLVNGETFFVYLEKTAEIEEVQFYNTSNGSVFGDAYGKFSDPTRHSGTLVFKPGDWIIFSNNLALTRDLYKLETGTCLFDGPLRNESQNLEGCFNSCQDYQTLEEAMQECLLEDLCEGVTYSHKLWGGANSQGFTRGYGYQLRTTQPTPSRNGFERKFEYSFKKSLINKKFQSAKDLICSDCSFKCNTCVSSADNCLQCSEENRINSPTCLCKPGFFQNASNNNQCDQCDHSVCATCQNNSNECITSCHPKCKLCDPQNTCLQVKDGFFKDPNDDQLKDCDHTKCATCQNNPDECIESCETGCTLCDSTYNCITLKPGYFKDPISQEINQCDHSVCVTCENQATQCIQACQEGCDLCDSSNFCHTPKPGYFLDPSDDIVKKCNNRKCATCTVSPDNCILPCNPGCLFCGIDQLCSACPLGQYLETGICKSCNPKCLHCDQNDKDTCIFCKSGGIGRSNNLTHKNCSCEDGYYENPDSLDCVKCTTSNCKRCDSSLQCIECISNEYILPDCINIKIKPGFFLDTSNPIRSIISQCAVQCEKCETSINNCQECSKGLHRQGPPSCACLSGYHDNQGKNSNCQKCPNGCKECLSSTICISCENNLVLNQYKASCECPLGSKLKPKTHQCEKCFKYQGKCLSHCPDKSTEESNEMICLQKSFINTNNVLIIWISFVSILFVLALQLVFKFISTRNLQTQISNSLQLSRRKLNSNRIQEQQQLQQQ